MNSKEKNSSKLIKASTPQNSALKRQAEANWDLLMSANGKTPPSESSSLDNKSLKNKPSTKSVKNSKNSSKAGILNDSEDYSKVSTPPKKRMSASTRVSLIWVLVTLGVLSVCIAGVLVYSHFHSHSHTFGDGYKMDETYHWRICNDCDEITDKAKHIYDNCLDATCNVCGYEREVSEHVYDDCLDATCNVCGFERVVMGHTYPETYLSDATHHWKICSVCGKITTKEVHAYDDCLDESCNVCGYIRTAGHIFESYDSDEANHWKVCKNCDATQTAEAHTFESGKCTVCDYIQVTEGLKYNYNAESQSYTVSGYNELPQYLRIPSTYSNGTNGVHPVTKIESFAFEYCSELIEVVIPESVTIIGADAFEYCSELIKVVIPESVTTIGEYAFSECTSLTSITITEGVTTIGDMAFTFTNISSISIPASVTTIGAGAFAYCNNLTSIVVDSKNTVYHCVNNCLIETATKKLVKGLKNSTIPTDGSVEIIGEYAFGGLNITDFVIPEGITTIGEYAFGGCESLTSITITEGITTIGEGAFEYCESLTSITITEGVTTIGDMAFTFTNISSISIPASVTTIGAGAFAYCNNLTSIVVDSKNTVYHCVNNCLIETATKKLVKGLKNSTIPTDGSVEIIGEYAFGGLNITDFVIPEGITTIGEYAFGGCESLTSITITEGITTIGEGAFEYCEALTSITIPESVTTIGRYAFNGCSALTSITIPEGITTIGRWAFYNCTKLTSIVIPKSVESVGSTAFAECKNLQTVYYGGTETEWDAITISSGIGYYFKNVTKYYFSETEPSTTGKYWHYVDGVITIW